MLELIPFKVGCVFSMVIRPGGRIGSIDKRPPGRRNLRQFKGSHLGEIPFYPTFYWIPFYPTLIFTILSNLFQKYHFIQLSMVVSKYRFIQLFLTFFDLKRFWLRFKNKLISAIRRCIKYGEKYIRTKVCSEHMFGTNLNFGKHIFGT